MRAAFFVAPFVLLAACAQDETAPVDSEVVADGDGLTATDQSLADPTLEGPTRQALVPALFHGAWDHVEGNCDPASDLRVEISGDALEFYESLGQVRAVRSAGEEAVVVDLAMTGEGQEWKTVLRLDRSQGDDRLIISDPGGAPEPTDYRKRCEA